MSSSSTIVPGSVDEKIQRLHAMILDEFDKPSPSYSLLFDFIQELKACALLQKDAESTWEECVHYFEELADKHYKEADCCFHIGDCYYELGRFRESRQAVEACLNLEPSHPRALDLIARIKRRVWRETKFVLFGVLTLGAAGAAYLLYKKRNTSSS